jgi:hypothetical protein
MGAGEFSLRIKWLMCEANHSPPSDAEVKNGGAIPPLPHMFAWRGAKLITHRNNFIYIFLPFTYYYCDQMKASEMDGTCSTRE